MITTEERYEASLARRKSSLGRLLSLVKKDLDQRLTEKLLERGYKNFRPGDVIVEAQNQPVKTPADLEARVDADAKAGKKAELMLVNRGGDLTYVGLRLE